jgi:hypothetical protein
LLHFPPSLGIYFEVNILKSPRVVYDTWSKNSTYVNLLVV